MLTQENSPTVPRFAKAIKVRTRAEAFLGDSPALINNVLTIPCQDLGLGLAFDQTESGLRGGSARLFKDPEIWLDTEQAFILTQLGRPIATVGFYEGADYFRIQQIQGVAGAKILYQLGRWEYALVKTVEIYAQATQINEVQVLPAKNNAWAKDYSRRLREFGGGSIKGLSPEKAKKRYDDVAVALGYEYDEHKEVYLKRWPFSSAVC